MSQNLTLYNLRVSRGLSLKEAAYQTLTNRLSLYLFERGYLPIPKNKIALYAAYYGVKKEVFADPLGYPTPIFPESKKPTFAQKMGKFLFRLPVLFVSIGLMIASGGVLAGGLVALKNVTVSHGSAGPDYAAIYDVTNEKGTSSGFDSLLNKGTTKDLTYTAQDDSSFTVSISTKTQDYFKASFITSVPLEEGAFIITLQGSGSSPYFKAIDMTTGFPQYFIYGSFPDSGDLEITSIQTIMLQEVDDQTIADAEAAYIQKAFPSVPSLFEDWLKMAEITTHVGLYDILIDAGQCGLETEKLNTVGDNLTLAGTICLTTFFFLTALIAVALVAKKRRPQPETTQVPPEDLPARGPVHPLPKNWIIRPFLPEYVLRLVGIGLILASSILFFSFTYRVLASLDVTKIFEVIGDATNWYRFRPLVTMAMLLWFFTKVEMIQNKSYNPIVSIIAMLACSILYYVAELSLTSYFDKGGDAYYSTLYLLFTKLMPGNLPASILSFTLIVVFLLTTPSFVKPKKTVWWRLLALLPIAYLGFSYFYAVGLKAWGWSKWPYWASSLLVRKQFTLITFAIFYPVLLYFYRLIMKKRYGSEQAAVYFEGNEYFFIKNFLACFVLALIIMANELFVGTAYAKAIGLSSNLWLIVLIPLVFFYHPHLGKRNSLADALITVIYFISLSFAYIYVGYYILFPLRTLLPAL